MGRSTDKTDAEVVPALVPQAEEILAASPSVMLVIDRAERIVFASESPAAQIAGARVGTSVLECIAARDRDALRVLLRAVFEQGANGDCDLTVQTAEGERTHTVSASPFRRNRQIVGAVLALREATRHRHDARSLIADRLAAVGTLASGVAHEINNPLAAVVANLELALRALADTGPERVIPDDLEEELREARLGAERIREIVRDLKMFTTADEEFRQPVDVTALIDNALRLTWNDIRHRALLAKDLAQVPKVMANSARLGQVIVNLLLNAAQAIPEQSTQAQEIRVSTRLDDRGRVVIEVSDTGVGMPPEVVHQLFTPFFTTREPGRGTGLSLAICHHVVTGMGGEITVKSTPGRGSTFSIFLPATDGAVLAQQARISRGSVQNLTRRGRVLVIDDEPLVTAVVQRTLATAHDVTTVGSARAALDLLGAGESFDVILCDLMMPEMSGMDLYDQLKLVRPQLAHELVFMTGGAFTPRAKAFLGAVSNAQIEKPFNLGALRTLIASRIR